MAEGDASVYNNFKEQLLLGDIDLANDTLRLILVTSGYTFSADGNPVYGDVSTYEIVASGYGATGSVIGSPAVTQDDTNDRAKFDGADVTWTALAAASPRGAILYDYSASSAWLLIFWELATDSNGGNYTLQFHTDGILLLS